MANSTLVQLKVDTVSQDKVSQIYEDSGLDLPTAIRIFIKKSIAVGGLPFELPEDNSRWNIYNTARKIIQNNNVPELTLDEINLEIATVREQDFQMKRYVVIDTNVLVSALHHKL